MSEAAIQKEMGIGSASTIRNHRFALKEKERQSKVYLAMREQLKEKDKRAPAFVKPRTEKAQAGCAERAR